MATAGHVQVCTSLQTDNHASTSPLSFLQAGYPSCCPTNIFKALKAHHYSNGKWRKNVKSIIYEPTNEVNWTEWSRNPSESVTARVWQINEPQCWSIHDQRSLPGRDSACWPDDRQPQTVSSGRKTVRAHLHTLPTNTPFKSTTTCLVVLYPGRNDPGVSKYLKKNIQSLKPRLCGYYTLVADIVLLTSSNIQIKPKAALFSAIRCKRIRKALWLWIDKLFYTGCAKQFGL